MGPELTVKTKTSVFFHWSIVQFWCLHEPVLPSSVYDALDHNLDITTSKIGYDKPPFQRVLCEEAIYLN